MFLKLCFNFNRAIVLCEFECIFIAKTFVVYYYARLTVFDREKERAYSRHVDIASKYYRLQRPINDIENECFLLELVVLEKKLAGYIV